MFFRHRNRNTGASTASQVWLLAKTPVNCDLNPGHRMTAEESLSRVYDKTLRSPLPSLHGQRYATCHKVMDPHIAPCSGSDDDTNDFRSGNELIPFCGRCPTWMLAVIALMALTMVAWGFSSRSLDSNNIAYLSYLPDYCFLFATPPVFNCETCIPTKCSFLVMKYTMGYRLV